ncbi:hypothetical protein SFRURICE_006323 [Spodoptera frugiperda]|nr:hypothetical protein SFRURICE_006323 [Spodoptera frugiperda]
MTFALGLNMRFISSLCFGEEFRYSANSLCINKGLHVKSTSVRFWTPRLPCSWTPVHIWISRAVQLHGMHNDQNLTPVDFYMKSLVYTEGIDRVSFEDNYEIKRIFSPRVKS